MTNASTYRSGGLLIAFGVLVVLVWFFGATVGGVGFVFAIALVVGCRFVAEGIAVIVVDVVTVRPETAS